jgi:uncharacterized protein YhfF
MEKRYVQLGQIEKIIEHSAKKNKPVLIYEYKLKDTKSKYFYQIERKMAFIEGEHGLVPLGSIQKVHQRLFNGYLTVKVFKNGPRPAVGEYIYRITFI